MAFTVKYRAPNEILVFRHVPIEGPGYLGHYLHRRGFACRTIRIDQGDTIPNIIDRVRGLVFLGGPMSANDNLPWIRTSLKLMQRAHARSIPMLGHCLGAQLIAKALGGSVSRNPVSEIGWFPIRCLAPVPGLATKFEAFHWHGETFAPPEGAKHLFTNEACLNQGFKIGNTIALQFHVEVLPDMVTAWAQEYADEITSSQSTVQGHASLTKDLDEKIHRLHGVADAIYDFWISSPS